MKAREIAMYQRNKRGYYWCKEKHADLYKEITLAMSRFITRAMLLQLNHTYSTQKNEAMNHSVSSTAPKSKHYSTTDSLLTRVGIAGACQILGHASFWTKVCSAFDFDIDSGLLSLLQQRDAHKRRKNARAATPKGKRKRSSRRHVKINKEHKDFMEGHNAGLAYESGIAVAAARKNLPTAAARNPTGTPKDQWKCPYYHPLYCTELGHNDCRSSLCGMKPRSKEEREVAKKVILQELLDAEVIRQAANSE